MAVIATIQGVHGGTVRIMDDLRPTTAEEADQRREAVRKACEQVLRNAIATFGLDEVLRRMENGEHAYLWEGKNNHELGRERTGAGETSG